MSAPLWGPPTGSRIFDIMRRGLIQWPLPPPKLVALRHTVQRSRAFVFVAEDQSSLFQIVGRYFHGYAIPGQSFDPILFHSSGGVSDQLMPVVELNAITGVGQYFGYETLEFQQIFLRHLIFLLNQQHSSAALVESGLYRA